MPTAAASLALALALHGSVPASHIPGHSDSDPTFPMPLPGPEFFSSGIIFVTLIGPPDGTQITTTTFDITDVSDGTTPASTMLMTVTAWIDGSPVEIVLSGTDLGFGSGPGTFTGTL